MLALLGTIFSSILSGGATGIIGVIAQRFADYKNKQLDLQREKQNQEFELQKRKVDLEITSAEWQGRLKVASEEGATAREVAETQAFAKTLLQEPERYSSQANLTVAQNWVLVGLDAVRGSVRPLLTIYLIVLESLIYFQARGLLSVEDLTADQALELEKLIVGSILYLTTTCVLWWFGTRNKTPKGD